MQRNIPKGNPSKPVVIKPIPAEKPKNPIEEELSKDKNADAVLKAIKAALSKNQ